MWQSLQLSMKLLFQNILRIIRHIDFKWDEATSKISVPEKCPFKYLLETTIKSFVKTNKKYLRFKQQIQYQPLPHQIHYHH